MRHVACLGTNEPAQRLGTLRLLQTHRERPQHGQQHPRLLPVLPQLLRLLCLLRGAWLRRQHLLRFSSAGDGRLDVGSWQPRRAGRLLGPAAAGEHALARHRDR